MPYKDHINIIQDPTLACNKPTEYFTRLIGCLQWTAEMHIPHETAIFDFPMAPLFAKCGKPAENYGHRSIVRTESSTCRARQIALRTCENCTPDSLHCPAKVHLKGHISPGNIRVVKKSIREPPRISAVPILALPARNTWRHARTPSIAVTKLMILIFSRLAVSQSARNGYKSYRDDTEVWKKLSV